MSRGPRIVLAAACLVLLVISATSQLAAKRKPPPTDPDARLEIDRRIAVLPLTNRSGRAAPLGEIQTALRDKLLGHRGFWVLDDETLARFMRRHRMRYTGGLNGEMARALREEEGIDAVFITSLDLYQERNPPKMAITSRLVTTEDEPRILWMDSDARSGDQAPGVADTGLIDDPEVILDLVTTEIAFLVPREAVWVPAAEGEIPVRKRKTSWKFRPKIYYASPEFPIASARAGRVVVLPFANDSRTRNAGEVMADLLMVHLVEAGADVVEPGVVRQTLLAARQIYHEGPSVPEMDILRVELRADVILFGDVERFSERSAGAIQPFVDFSFNALDTSTQQVIWTSFSYSHGNAGVAFFDVGAVETAHGLASQMARALVATVRLRQRKQSKRR